MFEANRNHGSKRIRPNCYNLHLGRFPMKSAVLCYSLWACSPLGRVYQPPVFLQPPTTWLVRPAQKWQWFSRMLANSFGENKETRNQGNQERHSSRLFLDSSIPGLLRNPLLATSRYAAYSPNLDLRPSHWW